jgi:adenosylmethionine---8-amino-7-oxononanoate aminotransferase
MNSNAYLEKDLATIWHPYTSLVTNQKNRLIESAEGVYLILDNGDRILDAISSWWVNLHGHSHPYLAQKIAEQAGKLEHAIFAGFTHKPAIELADRLLPLLPGHQKRIFYSDNGSTAVEVALKMALQYHINSSLPKNRFIALEGAFHGDTFGAMSVSERGLFTNHFKNHLFEVSHIPFPEQGKEHLTIEAFEKELSKGDVAAFIYEPLIQGAAGMRMYSAFVLEQLVLIAQKNNILCIADEVMTGFGRTGKLFASEHINSKPDIICLSKGITGGCMPFGATACSQKVESVFLNPDKEKTFFHGHSFTGNPLACAASLASLDLLLSEDCQKSIQTIKIAHESFAESIKEHPAVRKVTVLGTILSIEINTKEDTGYTNSLRDELYNFFLNNKILLRPLGNILYVLPPYIISAGELDLVYKTIEKLLKKIIN